MRRRLAASVIAATTFLAAVPAHADLSLATWEGRWGDAVEASAKRFSEASGEPVAVRRHDGSLASLRRQHAPDHAAADDEARIDLIDVESGAANLLCDEGLARVMPAGFWQEDGRDGALLHLAQHDCGAGYLVTSLAIAAATTRDAPADWQAFFDTDAHEGPRALPRSPRGTLEAALMADGAAPAEVYPLLATEEGVARAFEKLGTLAPDVALWWTEPAEALAALEAGDIAYSALPHVLAAEHNMAAETPLPISFGGQIYRVERMVLLADLRDESAALDFLGTLTGAREQAALAQATFAGPVAREAWIHIPVKMAAWLPTAPGHGIETTGLSEDADFWARHGDALAVRFAAFLAARGPAVR